MKRGNGMPGYVIHLAVANEYMRKNNEDIKDKTQFILGVIAPDSVKDKSETHYGPKSSQTSLRKYLETNEIDSDFDKGYFLHLITDFIFYNKVIDTISNDIYNDYDILNKYLIEKYNVELPEKAKQHINFKVGKTKILSKEKAQEAIEKASDVNLLDIKNKIISSTYCEEWEKIRLLKRI